MRAKRNRLLLPDDLARVGRDSVYANVFGGLTMVRGLWLIAAVSIGLWGMPALAASIQAAPAASGGDAFAGAWQADMSTVPPQQPPLKSQTFAFTKTADGYTTKQTSVKQTKGGGTSSTWIDGRIVLSGKPYPGTMGDTRTCHRADADTIDCSVAMGPNSFEETYALSDGGKTFTDTMKGKDEQGNEHAIAVVYRGHSGAAPSSAALTGPQHVVTRNGECDVTVPAGWTVDPSMREAWSAGSAVDVHVFTTDYAANMKSLADLKPLVSGAYKPVKVFEDTPKRLWYQYAPHPTGNGWYVATLAKTGTCNLEIAFRNSVIPDQNLAKQIALSLKAVP